MPMLDNYQCDVEGCNNTFQLYGGNHVTMKDVYGAEYKICTDHARNLIPDINKSMVDSPKG